MEYKNSNKRIKLHVNVNMKLYIMIIKRYEYVTRSLVLYLHMVNFIFDSNVREAIIFMIICMRPHGFTQYGCTFALILLQRRYLKV